MKITLTSQQTTHFNKNGFLELEGLFSTLEATKYNIAIQEALDKRKAINPIIKGRDLWRDSTTLKSLVCSHKLSKLALQLTGKSPLMLACDQWFAPSYCLAKPEKLGDLLSVQGILCILLIQLQPGNFEMPENTSQLGLSPFPQGQGNVLLVKPSLLINWPSISTQIGLYAVAYSAAASVYIHNPKDPAGESLKLLGYGYGDRLTNETNPSFTA